jgi:hypothetical protein
MEISEARKKYLFTTRIELPGEAEETDIDFIILREPSIEEIEFFNSDGQENFKVLRKLFPKCLVNHSFLDTDGAKAKNEEVYKMLLESSSLCMEIIENWFRSIPFQSRMKRQKK